MIRKLQTTLKLPKSSKYCKPLGFCKTAIPQLKIKISAKPHHKIEQNRITTNPYALLLKSSCVLVCFLACSGYKKGCLV